MSILGIDYEKCTNCGLCVKECGIKIKRDKEKNRFYVPNPTMPCFSCGHCIAICPKDAIIYENFGDEPYTFDGIENLEQLVPFRTIYNFFRANRSIRQYKKKKVPNNVLRKVFDAMQCAPTGGNLRAEKYVVLSDDEKINKLSDAVMEELQTNPSWKSVYSGVFELLKRAYNCPIYFDAPHVIFVYGLSDNMLDYIHIGIKVTYGRIIAQALGLGTCWNGWTMGAFSTNRKLLKLAGVHGKSWGVFTIGYPNAFFLRCPPRSKKRVKGLDY